MGMALSLYDEVAVHPSEDGLQIKIFGPDSAKRIPLDQRNLVFRAVASVYQEAGRELPGLAIELRANIPVAGGLGSSAAALVGGVVAANWLCGGVLPQERLLNLAAKIEGHPDNVAPALLGGVVVSAATAEGIIYKKIVPPPGLRTVVAIPHFPLSTREAREVLPAAVSRQDAIFNVSRASLLTLALREGDFGLMSRVLEDRLHQPFRAKLVPGMEEVFGQAVMAGALGVTLSGAGPTLIAFLTGDAGRVGQAMKDTFARFDIDCTVKEIVPASSGAEILDLPDS
jgi:homoserine kinase